MRLTVALSALAAVFVLTPVATGYAPALSQDFSITNQEPVGTTPFRRDLMRQLQAWWDVHAYYPKHASNNDEGGTVKIHLRIKPSGSIFMVTLAESSGSPAIDAAGLAAFRTGAVRPFPETEPEIDIDLPLHYVLAHRHDEMLPAGYTATSHRGAFTIANDPVKSVILETMLQKTCTGMVTRNGGYNQYWRGMRVPSELIFFRKPDGTPWVKFSEGGQAASISPVVTIGNMLQFVGPMMRASASIVYWNMWTVWPDGPNHLHGAEGSPLPYYRGAVPVYGFGGPVDFTCNTETVPVGEYSTVREQTMASSPGDPP